MAVMKWSPFREFNDLRREMDHLFDEFFGRRIHSSKEKTYASPGVYSIPLDIYEKEGTIVVKAVIPGVNKEDIEVSFLENVLTIRGERKIDKEIKDENYYCLEQQYGSFSRTVTLPLKVDPEGMKAGYQDGILEVTIPKSKTTKSKEIKLEVQ